MYWVKYKNDCSSRSDNKSFIVHETLAKAKWEIIKIKKVIAENSNCMNEQDKKDLMAEHADYSRSSWDTYYEQTDSSIEYNEDDYEWLVLAEIVEIKPWTEYDIFN